jgi:hypothetical protein
MATVLKDTANYKEPFEYLFVLYVFTNTGRGGMGSWIYWHTLSSAKLLTHYLPSLLFLIKSGDCQKIWNGVLLFRYNAKLWWGSILLCLLCFKTACLILAKKSFHLCFWIEKKQWTKITTGFTFKEIPSILISNKKYRKSDIH